MISIQRKLNITIPKTLPKAVGYRMVVIVPEFETKTTSGIIIPEERKDAEGFANSVAYVAAQGPDCYKDTSRWCEVGEWVLIGKYDGQRVKCEGTEVRILNDVSILAVIPDPNTIQRAA
jgi:co-chaperonin GroES (HSP10)